MLNKDNVMQVTNNNGITFNVRLVLKGDNYGRNGCLIHNEEDPMIEFYDTRYDLDDWEGLGQFVSRYYLSTLLERDTDFEGASYGIQLEGDVDVWYVNGENVDEILGWAEYKVEIENKQFYKK